MSGNGTNVGEFANIWKSTSTGPVQDRHEYRPETVQKLHAVEGDARRWDDLPKPPAPHVSESDFQLLLTLYTSNPWVYAAISRIASAVSSVRKTFFTKTPDGKRTRSTETRLEKLLAKPNPWQTWQDLVELLVVDIKTVGWSIWEIGFDELKTAIGLWRLRPDRVSIDPDTSKYWQGITFERKLGEKIPIAPHEIVFFRHWSPVSDYHPISGLFASQVSVIWELFARAWNTSFFRNGAAGMPEGLFETDKRIDEDTYKRIHESLKNKLGNPAVWRDILILDQGLKFKETARKQNELQFSEMLDKARDEILASLGVPPAMVGVPIAGGLGGFREQRHQFYQCTVLPLLKKIQSTINRSLAPADEEFEFDLSDIFSLIEDLEALTRTAESEVTRGIRTINEVRSERGLGAVPWGDTWHRPLGLAEVDAVPTPPGQPPPGTDPAVGAPTEGLPEDGNEGRTLRRSFWKAAVKPLRERMADRMGAKYRKVFSEIKRLLLERADRALLDVTKLEKQDEPAPQFEISDFSPLEDEEFREAVREIALPEAVRQTNGAGRVAARALGVSFRELTQEDPLFSKVLDEWLTERHGSTANTMRNAVTDSLRQSRTEGISRQDAVRNLETKVDAVIDQRIADLSRTDATTFSNTAIEAQGIGNFTHKRWIDVGDADVRDPAARNPSPGESHKALNFPGGAVVKLDEKFTVPGRGRSYQMEFPGDPAGGPEVTSNCRCSLELLSQSDLDAEEAR